MPDDAVREGHAGGDAAVVPDNAVAKRPAYDAPGADHGARETAACARCVLDERPVAEQVPRGSEVALRRADVEPEGIVERHACQRLPAADDGWRIDVADEPGHGAIGEQIEQPTADAVRAREHERLTRTIDRAVAEAGDARSVEPHGRVFVTRGRMAQSQRGQCIRGAARGPKLRERRPLDGVAVGEEEVLLTLQ